MHARSILTYLENVEQSTATDEHRNTKVCFTKVSAWNEDVPIRIATGDTVTLPANNAAAAGGGGGIGAAAAVVGDVVVSLSLWQHT